MSIAENPNRFISIQIEPDNKVNFELGFGPATIQTMGHISMHALCGNVLRGIATVITISPGPIHYDFSGAIIRSDMDALRDDWVTVGRDIRGALDHAVNLQISDGIQEQAQSAKPVDSSVCAPS